MENILSSRYLIRKGLFEFVKDSLSDRHYGVVVDVGVGKAPYRSLIKCDKYISVDIERRGNPENLILADINESLPLQSNSVDLVIMTEVLEHLRNPGIATEEIFRVLRPGGRAIMTTPLLWPIHEEPNDYQRFTKYGLRSLLEKPGFKDIKVIGYGNYILSMVILLMFPLRNKLFMPLVLILNLIGLVFIRFKKGSSVFMISNYIIAIK